MSAPPERPEFTSELDQLQIGELAHDDAYADVALSHLALADQHANGVAFQSARWDSVDLSGSRLQDLRILDGEIEGCDLSNMRASRAHLTRVRMRTNRLTGIDLAEAVLRDVTVEDCRVDLAAFGFTHLAHVTFEDCRLVQTDFLDARLEDVSFQDCDLTEANFRGAALSRCEFRRCELSGVQGVENLRGASMEWSDIVAMAGVWAAALGIEVLDRD